MREQLLTQDERQASFERILSTEKSVAQDYVRFHAARPNLLLRDRALRFEAAGRPMRPVSDLDHEAGTIPGCEDKPYSADLGMIVVRHAGEGVEKDVTIPATAGLRRLERSLGEFDELNPHEMKDSIRPVKTSFYSALSDMQKSRVNLMRGDERDRAIARGEIDKFDDIFPAIVEVRAADMHTHHWAKRFGPQPDPTVGRVRPVFDQHLNALKGYAVEYYRLSDELAQFQKDTPNYRPLVVRARDQVWRREYRAEHGLKEDPPGLVSPAEKDWKGLPTALQLRGSELNSEIAELQGLTPVELLNEITGKQYKLPAPETQQDHAISR